MGFLIGLASDAPSTLFPMGRAKDTEGRDIHFHRRDKIPAKPSAVHCSDTSPIVKFGHRSAGSEGLEAQAQCKGPMKGLIPA